MERTILVTLVEDIITKSQREIYGRYDAVTLSRQHLKIIDTYKQKYEMSDATFAQYGTKKGEKIS